MKTIILSMMAFILIMMLSNHKVNAQASVLGNLSAHPTTDFLGWDITSTNPDVKIKHELDQPISFYTNAGHGLFNNQRMFIDKDPGFVGIGLNFLGPLYSLLQIDGTNNSTGEVFLTNCPNTSNSYWRLQNGGTEMGNICTYVNDIATPGLNNFSMSSTQKDITFLFGVLGANQRENMRIVGPTRTSFHDLALTVNAGNVGIGNVNPLSMLHIGGDLVSTCGYRNWMNVGTLMASRDIYTDQMYVGLKQEDGNDRNKEVINWGDNPIEQGAIQDMLSFIYTAPTGFGVPASGDGLEVGRMVSDGTYGYVGFGSFDGSPYPGIDPVRRLEVLDNGEGAAQLRLTYTQATPPHVTVTGIWTDFQATSAGNMLVIPINNGAAEGVGIGASSGNTCSGYPITTLHVGNSGTTGSGEITSDGLLVTHSTTTGFNLVYNNSCGTFKSLPGASNSTDVLTGNGTWQPYVPGGLGLGYCTPGPVPQLSTYDAGLDLNGQNLIYQGQDATNDRFGIGYSCSSTFLWCQVSQPDTITN